MGQLVGAALRCRPQPERRAEFGAGLGCPRLARQPASERYTYGYKSATIQAALLNAALLYAALGFILWDAIDHLRHPAPVNGRVVMVLAGYGYSD